MENRNGENCRIEALDNGPLLVHGPVRIVYKGEEKVLEQPKVFLCRCGQSANKPFCDGTHKKIGFEG